LLKTSLKYIYLAALLGSIFFNTQAFAAACATGPAPSEGCEITSNDTTYNMEGDITPDPNINGISFSIDADNNILNLIGNIAASGDFGKGVVLTVSDFNKSTITGNITTAGENGWGILFEGDSDSNTTTIIGNIDTQGLNSYGIFLENGDSNTINVTGNVTTTEQGSDGLKIGTIDFFNTLNTINVTGNITTITNGSEGIYMINGGGNTINLAGNISTTGTASYGIFFDRNNHSNTTNITGNITTTAEFTHGIYLVDSDNNTFELNGDLDISGIEAYAIFNELSSQGNSFVIDGLVKKSDNSDNSAYALYNLGGINNLTLESSAGITATASDTLAYGVRNQDSATITSFTNGGIIKAIASNRQAYGISNYNLSSITELTNSGTITAQAGSTARGISNHTSSIVSLTNTGEISASVNNQTAVSISNHSGTITTLINSGTIKATASDNAYAIQNYDGGEITTLINTGTISAVASNDTAYGIYVNDGPGLSSTISTLTNTGTISGSVTGSGLDAFDIKNDGVITTFNNQQTGLTYSGTLPVNYNIIINSPTSYGQMFVTSEAGSTNFGVSSASNKITIGKYTNVMTGVSDGSVGATRTGSLIGDGQSAVGTANWVLSETASGSSAWDLNITGDYVYFGSVATLQSSVNNTATAMRGAFNSITSSMNFANMTTYDCNLFGNNGGCVSVGGRYTGTDNPDTTATAVVAKAGYKFNEHFRYGAFVDQTANSKTGNVDMDMNTPMVGLMGVWNQNPDQLGMQVKLANTYQSTDATITRNGAIDNFKGDTDINAQSYVAELSWRHLNHQKDTLLQPFVATRYAIIDQDGYSDGFVNYGSVEQKTLTALAGVKAFYQYSHKMTYMGSLGVEHDLDEDADDLSVSVSGVSGLTAASMTDGGEDKTRILGSVGARFFVTPNQRLEGKLMYEQLRYNNADNTTAYVNYTIGF
jgi:hypothetical protein